MLMHAMRSRSSHQLLIPSDIIDGGKGYAMCIGGHLLDDGIDLCGSEICAVYKLYLFYAILGLTC
jgi:hypothetical protein